MDDGLLGNRRKVRGGIGINKANSGAFQQIKGNGGGVFSKLHTCRAHIRISYMYYVGVCTYACVYDK